MLYNYFILYIWLSIS